MTERRQTSRGAAILEEATIVEPEKAAMNDVDEDIESLVSFCSEVLVAVVRAFEKRYSEGAKALARKAILEHARQGCRELASQAMPNDLEAFVSNLEKGCKKTHSWERKVDASGRVRYRFTRCLWADKFRELHAQDIGKWFCDCDEPGATAFNPKIQFRRTKTLMEGADHCDHTYWVEE
jgi:hypothetical protein